MDSISRPDVERFVVPSKDAQQRVLHRPLAPVIVQYVLVVLHILRQILVLHQSPIKLLLCLRLRLLDLLHDLYLLDALLVFLRDSVRALVAAPAMVAHLLRWFDF